jgi:catalase
MQSMASDKPERIEQCPVMTTNAGRPVGDNQNSVTVGPRGPVLMEDYLLFEKTAAFTRGPVEEHRFIERCYSASGEVGRYNHREGNDDYTQAGDLFWLPKKDEKERLIQNIMGHMGSVPKRIQRLQISHFTKADPAYGRGVAEGLILKVEEPELVGAK